MGIYDVICWSLVAVGCVLVLILWWDKHREEKELE